MCDFVWPILEVIKFIVHPVRKYPKYHRKFHDYVYNFKQAQSDLQDKKADIRQQLQDEHGFGKKPKQNVESWFKKAEEVLFRAQHVEDEVRKGKCLFRSCLGKLVDETTRAMKELVYVEGHFSGSLVVNDPSTTTTKLPTPELKGESNITEEIYKYLIGDEVRKIGVCGMGGIGKTTIVKHVYNRLLEETRFSKLIWITISQDFDIRRLQKSVACQLKESFSDDEDATISAAKLSEMLRKQGRCVIVLDDVWRSFSLEDVGIIEPTTDNGCKLVLTTRSEEVVRSMGCKKMQMAYLSVDEAMQLFSSKVGLDLFPNPTLEPIMKLIVGKCGGLPLAIVTVAGCMRGVSDVLDWENALNELRGYIRNIQDMEDKVFGCLKFSYDHLRQTDKDCFLFCSLYPEDYEIEKEEIIEYWMEEGLIHVMGTRKAMQGSGYFVLKKIEENCLLERVFGGTHIKMHDVVRDMALHITRKRFLIKAGMQLDELPNEEEWTEDLEKVSLMHNSISTIPPNMKFPKFQKLSTLFLSRNRLKEIPESFFENFPNLKILDLSCNPIVSLPSSISNLENLTALLVRDCRYLKRFPSLSKLQALKKLDLKNTPITEVPQGLAILVNLRYLDLGYSKHLKEIPHGLLSKLCRLQYLALHPLPAIVEEMMELNKLEVFEGCFTNVLDWIMYDGQRKKLHKYLIGVSHDLNDDVLYNFNRYVNYSKKVAFVSIEMSCRCYGVILPYDIQQLQLYKCRGMRSLKDVSGWEDVTDLKECTIWECEELEFIVLSKHRQLETLESLHLYSLKKLKGIVGESSVCTFSSLKQIYVSGCGKIKNLFLAKWTVQNLEDITIGDCEEMEEIIVSEEEGIGTIKYILPKLRILKLSYLPKLKSICSKNGVMVCDSLQQIHIHDCPKLNRIPLYLSLLDLDMGKPSPPPLLKEIWVGSKEWWEAVEWDHPVAKKVLLPFLKFPDEDASRWGIQDLLSEESLKS